MPPYVYREEDTGSFSSPFLYLHPGIGKSGLQKETIHPHVFQQSVTLTASMWNENDHREDMENWNLGNWRIFREYSPLFVGLVCGFGIVILVISTAMLWRYCLLSAKRKVCCKGVYGEMTAQIEKTCSPPSRNEKSDNQNGFENFQSKSEPILISSTLQRSMTVGSMLPRNAKASIESECKFTKLRSQDLQRSKMPSNSQTETTCFEPPVPIDNTYSSLLHLQKLDSNCPKMSKSLSRSTPALEDLYAKVNFSKKKKNRMRKNDAAIIALSKSLSGHNDNTLTFTDSAVVVYNERTAL